MVFSKNVSHFVRDHILAVVVEVQFAPVLHTPRPPHRVEMHVPPIHFRTREGGVITSVLLYGLWRGEMDQNSRVFGFFKRIPLTFPPMWVLKIDGHFLRKLAGVVFDIGVYDRLVGDSHCIQNGNSL